MRSRFQISMRSIAPHLTRGAAFAGPAETDGSGAGSGASGPPHARAQIIALTAIAALVPAVALAELERAVSEIPLVAGADPLARLRPPIGEPRSETIGEGDTLLDVAFRNRVGFQATRQLNPQLDVWLPEAGSEVQLPTQLLLPDVQLSGLTLNVPEMRLFDASDPERLKVLAAAVGDAEDPTPVGSFSIRDKRVDPTWVVPESIRQERPELPEEVPAGPQNPLGSRWMRIGNTAYGIHGTNIRWSIGRRATHGCVRLYEDEIQALFDRTPEGTPLRLIYQPYKWGRQGRTLLFEAHPDLYDRMPDRLAAALALPRELGILQAVDVEAVWRAVEEARGVPVPAGRLPESPSG